MGRPLKISKTSSIDTGYNNPAGSGNTYGVVAGNTNQTNPTIQCRVKIGANAEANGYIIRQKGARKFLVSDGTNTGICVLANLANGALTDDTMTITVTKADTSTTRLARLAAHDGIDFSNNHYTLTFNAAAGASPSTGIPYAIVQVANA
jgi:hypothetical protein